MLRPETARLFTTMLVWNCPSNSVAQPTGQPVRGLAMVESPAIQTLVAAATAAAGFIRTPHAGEAAIASAALGLTADTAVRRALRSSRRALRMVSPDGGRDAALMFASTSGWCRRCRSTAL